MSKRRTERAEQVYEDAARRERSNIALERALNAYKLAKDKERENMPVMKLDDDRAYMRGTRRASKCT